MKYGIKVNRLEFVNDEPIYNWRNQYLIAIQEDDSSHLYWMDDFLSNAAAQPLRIIQTLVSYDMRADVYLTVNKIEKTIEISRDCISWTRWRRIPERITQAEYISSLSTKFQAFYNRTNGELEFFEAPNLTTVRKFQLPPGALGVQILDYYQSILFQEYREAMFYQDEVLEELLHLDPVSFLQELPFDGNAINDTRYVRENNTFYRWTEEDGWASINLAIVSRIKDEQLIRSMDKMQIAVFYEDKTILINYLDDLKVDILPRVLYFDYLFPEPFSHEVIKREQILLQNIAGGGTGSSTPGTLNVGYGVEKLFHPENPIYRVPTYLGVWSAGVKSLIPVLQAEAGRISLVDRPRQACQYPILSEYQHVEVFTEDGVRLAREQDNHTHNNKQIWSEAINRDVESSIDMRYYGSEIYLQVGTEKKVEKIE